MTPAPIRGASWPAGRASGCEPGADRQPRRNASRPRTDGRDRRPDRSLYVGPGRGPGRPGGRPGPVPRCGGLGRVREPLGPHTGPARHRGERQARLGEIRRSLGSPTAHKGFRQFGPDEYFRRNLGYGIEETPAHQFDVLADRMGVPLHWASPGDYQAHLGDFRPASEYPYASYVPVGPGKWNESIAIPTTRQMWWDPFTMKREMLTSGNPKVNPAFDSADMASQPILRPWLSTSDPRHVAVHELMHALHHREVGTPTFGTLQNDQVGAALVQELQDEVSRYALTNPLEAVADGGPKASSDRKAPTLLQAIPALIKKAQAGRDWWGPNIPKAKKDMGL